MREKERNTQFYSLTESFGMFEGGHCFETVKLFVMRSKGLLNVYYKWTLNHYQTAVLSRTISKRPSHVFPRNLSPPSSDFRLQWRQYQHQRPSGSSHSISATRLQWRQD